MSRSFNGTTDYLEHPAAVLSAYPITMACWFYLPALPGVGTATILMAIGDSAGSTRLTLYVANTGGVITIRAATTDTAGVANSSDTFGAPVAGVWQHACGVWVSSSSRYSFLNGGNVGQDLNTRTLGAVNTTTLGARYNTGVRGGFWSGSIAEAGIWSAALGDFLSFGQIAALALGVSPLLIDPSNLKAYWPLSGCDNPELDRKSRFDLRVNGAKPQLANYPRLQPLLPRTRHHRGLTMASCAPLIPQPEAGNIAFNRFAAG